MKRRQGDVDESTDGIPPPAKRQQVQSENGVNTNSGASVDPLLTPTKRKRGRPPGSKNKSRKEVNGVASPPSPLAHRTPSTPKSTSKGLFSTPTKLRQVFSAQSGSPIPRNADRSARRKSARALLAADHDVDSDSDPGENSLLARRIWDAEGGSSSHSSPSPLRSATPTPSTTPATTPTKRPRGRPKGSRTKASPPPPQSLPSHERYFYQNRPAGSKTSSNTLSGVAVLSHAEYFAKISAHKDPHASSQARLIDLHTRSFPQWHFELSEGFNICLYGWGSKRALAMSFAEHIHAHAEPDTKTSAPKTLVINGYAPNLTPRDILLLVAHGALGDAAPTKLGSQPSDMLATLLPLLTSTPDTRQLLLIIHSFDAAPLRRGATPAILAALAAHPSISMLVTADTPNFPLLADSAALPAFNFLYHDATTFAPFAAEIDVVSSVQELLGESGRSVAGRDGVAYVLRSLPENARLLFRLLVTECLLNGDSGPSGGGGGVDRDVDTQAADEDDDYYHDDDVANHDGRGRQGRDGDESAAGVVEYRVLYQKAVEEFVCGNEMAFRTLLKE
ncbi:MAG: hypothetical protein M1825_001039 [Sarcosagium campestre]|nr:MAG: hypothetical protein M1825_001039 [Sarcosagium campestre]